MGHGNSRVGFGDSPSEGEAQCQCKCSVSPRTVMMFLLALWQLFPQVQYCEITIIHQLQREDTKLRRNVAYLEKREFPSKDKEATEILLSQDNFTLKEGVLYFLARGKILGLVAPASCRQKIFDEVHSGVFGGHLRETKIHSELSRHYWWPGMRKDICLE